MACCALFIRCCGNGFRYSGRIHKRIESPYERNLSLESFHFLRKQAFLAVTFVLDLSEVEEQKDCEWRSAALFGSLCGSHDLSCILDVSSDKKRKLTDISLELTDKKLELTDKPHKMTDKYDKRDAFQKMRLELWKADVTFIKS